ncbi:hypothetical protein EDD15DRAFT_2168130, partial [Pisolithus albus]
FWISPSQPFGIPGSRALSRLLTALTIKTVPRTHTTQQHTKARSLAKAFTKHVGHVLLAYINSMNDPLRILTPEIQRELEPGLSSPRGTPGRIQQRCLDGLFSVLDSVGKTIMKSLWRKFEKRRYVRKG